jgi:hypothetical protein
LGHQAPEDSIRSETWPPIFGMKTRRSSSSIASLRRA